MSKSNKKQAAIMICTLKYTSELKTRLMFEKYPVALLLPCPRVRRKKLKKKVSVGHQVTTETNIIHLNSPTPVKIVTRHKITFFTSRAQFSKEHSTEECTRSVNTTVIVIKIHRIDQIVQRPPF